jgi:hypothetical protein
MLISYIFMSEVGFEPLTATHAMSCVSTWRMKDDADSAAVPRATCVASTKVVGSAHLPLIGLDEAGTEAAVLHFARAEGGRTVEPRLLEFLHERSGGNPWHAKEWLLDRMKYELILVQGPEQRTGTDRDGTSLETPIMKHNTTVQVGEMHLKVR